jgi:hypothetical protein
LRYKFDQFRDIFIQANPDVVEINE